MSAEKHLIVIGGGAAGFFSAVNAARLNPNLRVTILEKTGKLLSKVKVSGGGRCNVTHSCFNISELIKKYPRGKNFLKKTFHQFNPENTIEWFESRGVALKTEVDGRMFPASNTSQSIIDCLLKEANKYHVEIKLHVGVESIEHKNEKWVLKLGNHQQIETDFVCIACGGFSKQEHFSWLEKIGLTVEKPVPSLFTFNIPGNNITQLMGISTNAVAKIVGSKLVEEGPVLITHWGMSGPAILRLSAWGARYLSEVDYQFSIVVNWLPDYNEQTLRNEWNNIRDKESSKKISYRNPFGLPNRLWVYLLEQSNIDEEEIWSRLPAKQQNKLIQLLTGHVFEVKGKTTFKEEFITCGGISLNDIDANTMQSRKHEGLFFAGEILDVDGITGGFNFQHAWTSGWIAAKNISAQCM